MFKIKIYRSATVGIDFGNFKILQDPWLTDGEYYGSWSHYPHFDLNNNLGELNSYDAIYISHIHPDHCSVSTLKALNKNIPIFIHKYHFKFLKFKLEMLGFKVIELENNKRTKLANNVYLNIIAADNCDPKLCYKFTGCNSLNQSNFNGSQQIDTLSVFDNNKNSILNINDCPYDLAKKSLKEIKKNYDQIDLLMMGYGGAGPYPQCFDNLNLKQKKIEGRKKTINFLNQGLNYITYIKPKKYLPFAGTYCLTGKLSKLQSLRGVPLINDAFEYFEKKIKILKLEKKIKPLKLDYEKEYIFGDDLKEYIGINKIKYNQYIKDVLSKKKLEYENSENVSDDELYNLFETAFVKFQDKIMFNNLKFKTVGYIDLGSKYIEFSHKSFDLINKKNSKFNKQYTVCNLDRKLLKKLLMGPKFAHWNNAEIGSHVNYYRKPNIYEKEFYMAMSFLHN